MANLDNFGENNARGDAQTISEAQHPTPTNLTAEAPPEARTPTASELAAAALAATSETFDADTGDAFTLKPDPAEYREFRTRYQSERARYFELSEMPVVYAPPIVAHVGGAPLWDAENLALIKGKTGTFKSSIAELVCGMLLSDGNGDFLGLTVPPDAPPVYVGYLDTERTPKQDVPALIQRVKKLANPDKWDWFFPWSLKGQTASEQHLINLCEFMRERATADGNADARLVLVLDVLSDFADGGNINNQESARIFVKNCEALASAYNAAFLGIIHENHGNDKAAGWMGTVWHQKCGWALVVSLETNADGDTVAGKIYHEKVRRGKKPPAAYFDKDTATQRLYSLSKSDVTARKRTSKGDGDGAQKTNAGPKADPLKTFVELRFSEKPIWTKTDLVSSGASNNPRISEWQIRRAADGGPYTHADGRRFSLRKSQTKIEGRQKNTFQAVFLELDTQISLNFDNQ